MNIAEQYISDLIDASAKQAEMYADLFDKIAAQIVEPVKKDGER